MTMQTQSTRITKLLELQKNDSLIVSIFIPTQPISSPKNIDADRTRFKNAIQEMDKQLRQRRIHLTERKQYRMQAEQLYQNVEFWRHMDKGLAVYVFKNDTLVFRLPFEITPLCASGDMAITTPLMIFNEMTEQHYILSLNLNHPQLFEASLSRFEEVTTIDLPGDMLHVLRIEEFEQVQQHHSVRSAQAKTQYHGHGGAKDNSDSEIENYLRLIDNALREADSFNQQRSLILAGTDSHIAAFRQIAKIRNPINYEINGNFEDGKEQLSHRVRQLLEDSFRTAAKEHEKMLNQKDQALIISTDSPSDLNEAARRGKLSTLVLNIFKQTRDKVGSSMKPQIRMDMSHWHKVIHKIEYLAQSVYIHGGDVVSLFNEDDAAKLKAVKRYK